MHRQHRMVFILTLIGLAALLYTLRDSLSVEQLRQWVSATEPWAPIVFIGLFIISALMMMPSSVFMLAAGAVFGPVAGAVYSIIAASLSALVVFLLARHFLADRIRQTPGGWVERIMLGVEREGWRYVAFARLVPVFPFNLVSYAFGVTPVPTLAYLVATTLFVTPPSIAYVYLGYAGAEAFSDAPQALRHSLIALTLLTLLYLFTHLIRLQRRRAGEL